MYYKGGRAAIELKREQDQWRVPELGEVKNYVAELFMKCPHADIEEDFSGFRVWFSATQSRLRELLQTKKSDEFYWIGHPYVDGDYASLTNRAQAAYRACANWLDHASATLRADEINPAFRIPLRPS